jgi:hypothetical protein
MEGAGGASKPSRSDWLNSPGLAELQRAFQEHRERTVREDAEWWKSLSEEDRLRAFRCVCSRIYDGDVRKRGSYRSVLYETFGFGPEAYSDGMDCGYMSIHNLIWQGIESQQPGDGPDCSLTDDEVGNNDNSF